MWELSSPSHLTPSMSMTGTSDNAFPLLLFGSILCDRTVLMDFLVWTLLIVFQGFQVVLWFPVFGTE